YSGTQALSGSARSNQEPGPQVEAREYAPSPPPPPPPLPPPADEATAAPAGAAPVAASNEAEPRRAPAGSEAKLDEETGYSKKEVRPMREAAEPKEMGSVSGTRRLVLLAPLYEIELDEAGLLRVRTRGYSCALSTTPEAEGAQ